MQLPSSNSTKHTLNNYDNNVQEMANAWNAKLFPPATWVMVKEKRKLSLQLATCHMPLALPPSLLTHFQSLSHSLSLCLSLLH